MSGEQLTLTLLAAYWAGTNVVFSGMKNVTEIRDKIIMGKIDKRRLRSEHAWQLLVYDWLPLKASLAAISFVLFVILFALPLFADLGNPAVAYYFPKLCYVAAIVPFIGFWTFILTGMVEFLSLRRMIKTRYTKRAVVTEQRPIQSDQLT